LLAHLDLGPKGAELHDAVSCSLLFARFPFIFLHNQLYGLESLLALLIVANVDEVLDSAT
jgi:hypothetical protein